MHDGRASAEELAALRAAVLRWHEELVGTLPGARSVRVWDGLQRLHLSWLVIPWIVVDAGRMFLSGLRRGFPVHDEQAVSLYRRLSGKDPQVARAEVWRIVVQLGELDERLRDPDEQRPGAPRGADPDELAVAAGALLGYYLAGRRTDDALLAEVEVAWAESEELTEQLVERSGIESALTAAVPTRRSRSGCRRRPTATARRGGAGLRGRPGRARRLGRVTADAGSRSRE